MKRILHLHRRLISVSVLCVAARVAFAQPAITAPRGASPASPQKIGAAPALTAQDVESFLDGMVPLQLAQQDIAGAVISVVKDGKLLFAKGYGFSDVAHRTPVTADATLFRIGSISKTFTWTAVMQLVEQGKLDLDRDVNTYVDFTIPAPYGKPVTMRHLLTHTAGFEENVKDLFVKDVASVRPLGEYLRTHLPPQIFPPGTTPAYSNYGAALAGYIVQRVSGSPLNDYIRLNVLAPLGMTRASIDQPLPKDLEPLMSRGYSRASQPPKVFEVVQAWPAGSMSASAEAMSRFMIAQLNDGEYGGARIL
jgi:CubicO group peptidase (beta-lactamase class C family)